VNGQQHNNKDQCTKRVTEHPKVLYCSCRTSLLQQMLHHHGVRPNNLHIVDSSSSCLFEQVASMYVYSFPVDNRNRKADTYAHQKLTIVKSHTSEGFTMSKLWS